MLNLACWLHEDTVPPQSLGQNGSRNRFRVDGCLAITGGAARVSVLLDSSWTKIPPVVICHEPWLQYGAEWHAFHDDSSLCYVLAREWSDKVESLAASHGVFVAAKVARFWIVRSVRWLLSKHLMADHLGIDHWQEEWGYYAHEYGQALRQYASHQRAKDEKRNRRHLRGRR